MYKCIKYFALTKSFLISYYLFHTFIKKKTYKVVNRADESQFIR